MNYVTMARTNYFLVKDITEFRAFAEQVGGQVVEDDSELDKLGKFYGLLLDQGIPNSLDDDEGTEIDFIPELAKHLLPGWVAVVIEAGYEGMRYLGGHAIAVNAEGTIKQVSTDDIYDLAKDLGSHITRAEY